ncbi:TetR/AcrR family transcriptional regulator [Flaviflexus salsibiostraticola]|uniref:TetR/AcrR family transcriptional regulator n=1 Tax=Flaviflexus salsibiostraticola TaxID=1282737 RepID=A0A3S8ZBA6_9ACTO|nr:TetR/AcrR family transcriptional regulator [Flaviflexus salsibiostraticola]AZN30754.1 TetR/AcrR family transcriptional regulator [Flaviflexus salsibiostraticola]
MAAPARTSNEEVISAARAVLESAGPVGLTMQAVARRVGVRAPSLYKRFQDREALLGAVVSAAIDELTASLEAAAPDLRLLAGAFRRFAHDNPEAFRLIFTPYAPQDALERSAGPVLECTASLVGEEHALEAARLLTAWATGFVHMELAGAFRLGGEVDEAFEYGLQHLIAGLVQSDPGRRAV